MGLAREYLVKVMMVELVVHKVVAAVVAEKVVLEGHEILMDRDLPKEMLIIMVTLGELGDQLVVLIQALLRHHQAVEVVVVVIIRIALMQQQTLEAVEAVVVDLVTKLPRKEAVLVVLESLWSDINFRFNI